MTLSDIKVGKKTPLTLGHFDNFFELLPSRADSEKSWTIDFAADLQAALHEAQPFREKAAEARTLADRIDDDLAALRKAPHPRSENQRKQIELTESRLKAAVREAREAEARATAIENAVYDLKAVNPNRRVEEDTRTPAEIITAIEDRGREADAALSRLRSLLAG